MKKLFVVGAAGLVGVAGAMVGSGLAAADDERPDEKAAPTDPVELSTLSIPSSTSDRPSLDAWKTAKLVEPTRRSRQGRGCRVYLVREWLKVHCDHRIGVIRQIAGPPDDVLLWVDSREDWDAHGAEVIAPLRRGEQRLFQLDEVIVGDYDSSTTALMVIEIAWHPDRDTPTVVLR